MKVPCSVCGNLFDAQRSTAKTCGDVCRKRASRATQGAKNAPAPRTDDAAAHPLVEQTRRELDEAGVLDTMLGQQAVRLAERMTGHFDTGSAIASLSRELRAVMAEALAGGTRKSDGLDELAARRMQKASGA